MAKYRVTKKIVDPRTGRQIHPLEHKTINLTGREAEIFHNAGVIDDVDRKTKKGKIKHNLDKRNH